jgi:5-methylcytosine-specific restriction endonuclease McrA
MASLFCASRPSPSSGRCPHKSKLWKIVEMDADHVTAWSKGGVSAAKNCQMLCVTHNWAKGNR